MEQRPVAGAGSAAVGQQAAGGGSNSSKGQGGGEFVSRLMGRRGQTSHFPWLAGLKKIKNLGNANGSRRNGIFMNE